MTRLVLHLARPLLVVAAAVGFLMCASSVAATGTHDQDRSESRVRGCPGKINVKNERYATRIRAAGMGCSGARRIVRAFHAGTGPDRKRWYCAVVGGWPNAKNPIGNEWFCGKIEGDRYSIKVEWVSIWD